MIETIGSIIKELRKEKGLTQPELANLLGVSKGIISLWENDINEPKASYIKKMAAVFNVSADYILGIDYEYKEKPIAEYSFEYNHGKTKLVHKEKK